MGENKNNSEERQKILDLIITIIDSAKEYLYISMPWWRDDLVGRKIVEAVEKANENNIEIKLEIRPDIGNKNIVTRLKRLNIGINYIPKLHGKAICTESRLLLDQSNYFQKDMLDNINFTATIEDRNQIEEHKIKFLNREEDLSLILDGPELWTNIDELIEEKEIRDLMRYKKLNPIQSLSCRHTLYGRDNILVIASTGAGKSTIGELAIFQSLIFKENKKAAWLTPSRSLATQIFEDLKKLNHSNIRPTLILGASEINPETLIDSNIWICTTEKYESLSRNKSKLIDKVDTLVIDEIHLIGEEGRGQTLESLISRYKDLSPLKRIVGLSATLENAEEFAGWLNARLLKSDWKPNETTTEVIAFESGISERWYEQEGKKKEDVV